MAAKLKKGDKVVMLAGKDKGKEGTISSIDPKSNKAVVDGINMVLSIARCRISLDSHCADIVHDSNACLHLFYQPAIFSLISKTRI